ncbi:DNA-binding domain-containing protein [uncultured Tateyamaria sp.]|uniref:HvfC/BufC N-terminal domain-containing protein n=1 Tax=uncultured Tateyamaria sp. TaxID=455651 RepID=UPI00262B2FA9|nr:DNA-binding domain-containing protein [uncultured Tateyamaria sp.]
MTELSEVQRWMHSTLLAPGSESQARAADFLTPMAHLDAAQALSIYQRSYALRLAACMREQFPATCHALGAALFNDFVETYVAALPPESYTLHDLGRRFAGFLADQRPDKDAAEKETWIDFLIDLARFERQVYVAHDCDGVESSGLEMADLATPDSALAVQPSLTVAEYGFDVSSYFHGVRAASDPPIPSERPSFVAVLRANYQTTTVPLSHAHFTFLQALCAGENVAAALSAVSHALGQSDADVRRGWDAGSATRQRWIDAGFFVKQPPAA